MSTHTVPHHGRQKLCDALALLGLFLMVLGFWGLAICLLWIVT